MSKSLVRRDAAAVEPRVTTNLTQLRERASYYANNNLRPATLKAYAQDAARFEAWCLRANLEPYPISPIALGLYISGMPETGVQYGSVMRALAAIKREHLRRNLASPLREPAVITALDGIRMHHRRPARAKRALLTDDLLRVLSMIGHKRAIDLRDRALLWVGFAGGLRRSELVSMDVEHLDYAGPNLRVRLSHTKTDKGQGQSVLLERRVEAVSWELCPVQSLLRWLQAAGIRQGPIWRSIPRHRGIVTDTRLWPGDVARIVKRRLLRAGIAGDFSAHSLRSGFATQAHVDGVGREVIKRQTRHKSEQVFSGYIQAGEDIVGRGLNRVGLKR